MTTGIVYLLTHAQLAARLVVSAHSLRRWYNGPITLFTTQPESHEIGQLMAADNRLRVDHCNADEVEVDGPYSSAYATKVAILPKSPYPATVFLDSDTLIVGPIGELVRRASHAPLTVTIYGEVTTTDPLAAKLWPEWRQAINQCSTPSRWLPLLDKVTMYSYPMVNTGVFTIQRDAEILHEWQELATVGRHTATADETALQLLLLKYPYQLLGCSFNCVPHLVTDIDDVRILHFAGASHLRFPECRRVWMAAYQECRTHRIAEINEWHSIGTEPISDNADNAELPRLTKPRSC